VSRQGDVVRDIKAAVRPEGYDFTRAEGRADFDDALRAEIKKRTGDDEHLRRHVGQMMQEWRKELFGWKERGEA
jgi:hypothetical protein